MPIRTLLLFLLPAAAFAASLNFDSLPAGTILTNQFIGNNVLFTPSGSSLSGRVTNVAAGEFSTASFNNSNPNALFVADPGDVLTIDFVTANGLAPLPATGVSFLAGDGDSAADLMRVTFFDASFAPISVQLISTVTAGVSVSCPGCTVGRIQLEALAPPTSPASGILIDDLTYEAVPEPSTAVLTGLAAAVGAFWLRRRQR